MLIRESDSPRPAWVDALPEHIRDDGRLWVAKEWWGVPPHGYGAKIEGFTFDGSFEYQSVHGFIGLWAAKRWLRREEKAMRARWLTERKRAWCECGHGPKDHNQNEGNCP